VAIYLDEDDVRRLLTMPLALEAVEDAHRAHAQGRAVDVPRQRTRLPGATLHILQGALPEQGILGYKAYTASRAGTRFRVHLFDARDGSPLAVIAADYLGTVRTGAAGGIAAKWLAREDASVLGVIGAGWQARSQIEAACAVRPIRLVKVFARNPEKLETFCAEMAARLSCEVRPARGAAEAAAGSDIVTTITTSATPVLHGEWLAPGVHVNAAGSNALNRRELDEAAIRKADLVCVDSRAVALRECGDLLPVLEKGRMHEGQLVEIGEVVAGMRQGRTGSAQITLFESHGMAIQDLAVARRLVAMAREQNLGRSLPWA
jgi:ornithine cyclodeaminase